MVNLPFEVVEDILCRLPVKPLKRFRCVAKSWRSLIDSKRFVKLHLKRALETMSHRHLILLGDEKVFDVGLNDSDRVSVKASIIKPPFPNGVNYITNSGNVFLVVSGEDIILWNPFTKEHKYLPRSDFPVPEGCYAGLGLAWDSVNDEYKVVMFEEPMVKYLENWVASRVQIWGSKSNSWRQIMKFNYSVRNWQAEVNGAYHTLILDDTPAKIMAFSFENEKHYEVQMPPSIVDTGKGKVLRMKLHKLGGCLSMSYTYESGIVIWVMKEYGARNSWTKLLSIPKKLTMADLNDNQIKPLVYTKDGHNVLLLLGYKTFFWQDLRNQTVDIVSVKGLPRTIENVETCVESLVSFHSEHVHKDHKQVHGQDKGADKKMTGKKRDDFLSKGFKLKL